MTVWCPVCRRLTPVNDRIGRVWKHRDTAGQSCPMGGHTIPRQETAA